MDQKSKRMTLILTVVVFGIPSGLCVYGIENIVGNVTAGHFLFIMIGFAAIVLKIGIEKRAVWKQGGKHLE